jgi:hypothetical protein
MKRPGSSPDRLTDKWVLLCGDLVPTGSRGHDVLVGWFSPALGLASHTDAISVVVGVGLLAFSLDVVRAVRNLKRSNVLRVIAGDVAWVVAAAIVIIGYPGSMSAESLWALGSQERLLRSPSSKRWVCAVWNWSRQPRDS